MRLLRLRIELAFIGLATWGAFEFSGFMLNRVFTLLPSFNWRCMNLRVAEQHAARRVEVQIACACCMGCASQ